MGRTIPSIRIAVDIEAERIMKKLGKQLGKMERIRLKNLLDLSKRQSQSCGDATRNLPLEVILLAMLVERQKRLEGLSPEKWLHEIKH